MIATPGYSDDGLRASPALHSDKWQRLCASYLPIAPENSVWRYSRAPRDGDPDQGWKLHISATILTANKVFETIAPYLKGRGTLFKAPRSLQELGKINSGLYYGYSQVGKFITVYPRSPQEAVFLARRLHRLTCRMPAPSVPFDSRFRSDSCVYYRYGSFEPLEIENADGTRTPAMRDREGKLVPDLRDSAIAKPDWVIDPFTDKKPRRRNDLADSPLKTTFRAFQALAQRGKGGVYSALDLSARPPRLCILKEGRRNGEVSWDGRDGYRRIKREEQVLTSLRAAGVEVPIVYSSFEAQNNYYLVTEFIVGETLQAFLLKKQRRLSVARALWYGVQLSTLLSRIHAAGWVWRDCKPTNLILAKDGRLRPVDFEGACPINLPDPLPWSTPAFIPPQRRRGDGELSPKYDDLYALGAVIYFLLAGQLLDASAPVPVEKLRRRIPPEIRDLVGEMLDANPLRRPEALNVRQRLVAVLSTVCAGR